jgi:hypothetical protein
MLVHTRDFVDVTARARELGCQVPLRIALLPGNFATAANGGEFSYHVATPYVRSAWQTVGLEDEGPQARDKTHSIHSVILSESDKSKNLFARSEQAQPSTIGTVSQAYANAESADVPLVAFFGSGLLTGMGSSLAVALSLVSRVLASHPACASPREVRFDAVVKKRSDGYACLEYRGDAYGLSALTRDVRVVWESAGGGQSGEANRPLHEAAGEGCRTEMEEADRRNGESKEGGAGW